MRLVLSLLFFFSITVNAQEFTNTKVNGYYNNETAEFKASLNGTLFEGKISKTENGYYYLSNKEQTLFFLWVSEFKPLSEYKTSRYQQEKNYIKEAYIIEGDPIKVAKKVGKKGIESPVYTMKEGSVFTYWDNETLRKKAEAKKDQLDEQRDLKNHLGTYKIKIVYSGGMRYLDYDYKGTVHITEDGITFLCPEIPSISEIRGAFMYDDYLGEGEKGLFSCRALKGYYDDFSMSINQDKKVGSISVKMGNRSPKTTTFIIEEYYNE